MVAFSKTQPQKPALNSIERKDMQNPNKTNHSGNDSVAKTGRAARHAFYGRVLLALVSLSFLLMAWAQISVSEQKYPVPESFTESPMLANMGLPPVAERLPKEPFVVGPGVLNSEQWLDWEVGQHGGTIRVPNLNGTVHELLLATGMTLLRAPDQSTKDPLPAILSSYAINEDFSEYTLSIREGLRWSDGVLVTTEDVRFTFELYTDERIYGAPPSKLKSLGDPANPLAELEIIDDYTFKLSFDRPYGFFLAELSSWIPDYTLLIRPAHYIKQFHGDYTDIAEIQPMLDELELESWEALVELKDMPHWEFYQPQGLGVPTLAPWIVEVSDSTQARMVRNPYYWKVDIAGNQLPYVDNVVAVVSNELETIILKAAAGEYDVVTSYAQLKEMPLYQENAERSNIRTVLHGSINNPPNLWLNHDFDYQTEGSAWQQLVSDSRFGKALALAVNSDDLNNNLYFGLYTAPIITDAEFDLAQANVLLDEVGMSGRDSEGFRLDANGNPFTLAITTAAVSPDFAATGELLRAYFEDAGLRTRVDIIESTLWNQRMQGNELMATIHWSDEPIWAPGISQDYCPYLCKGHWGPASGLYIATNGASGREPPAYIQKFFDLDSARKAYPPESEQGAAMFQELMDWFGEHYAIIFLTGKMTVPTLYNADLGNVIKEGYPFDRALDYGMEQIFFRTQ